MRGILILLVFLPLLTFSQTHSFDNKVVNSHAIKDIKEKADDFYNISRFDSALFYYEKGLVFSKNQHNSSEEISFLCDMGSVYDNLGQYDKAQQFIANALSLAVKAKDFESTGTALNLLGGVYFRKGEYKNALQVFYYALNIKYKSGELIGVSSVLNNIANLYYCWGDYKRAKNLHLQSYKILLSQKDSVELCAMLLNVGNSYLSVKNYDSALYFYDAAITLSKNQNNEIRLIGSLNNKAYLLIELGHYTEAIELLNTAITIARPEKYMMEYLYILRNLGEAHLLTHKPGIALQYFKQSSVLSDSIGLIELQISLLELQSRAHQELGQYKEALDTYKQSKQLNDSVFSKESQKTLYEFQVRYETRIKENQLLQKDLQIAKHKGQVRNQWFISALFLIGLVSAFILVWLSLKNKSRIQEKSFRQQIIRQQQMALSAQMNPHFVSNSLNSIQRFYLQNDYETATDYLSEFGTLIRIILENSSKDFISVDEEIKFIKAYLKLEHLRLEKKFNYHIHVSPEISSSKTFIPPLILQPFAENAIWHGIAPLDSPTKPQLLIRFEKIDQFLVVTIDDEGIGINRSKELKKDFGKKRKSYAMEINSKRLALLGTLINVKIEPEIIDKSLMGERGTRVTLRIPYNLKNLTE